MKDAAHEDESLKLFDDLAQAERLWIVESQSFLMQDKLFETWRRLFNLFTDANNVWRCGGILGNADLDYSTVLLSRKHPLTTLIVKDAHYRVQHNGIKETHRDESQILDSEGEKPHPICNLQMCYLPKV